MSTNSGIEWTNATWNPVSGCTRVNDDCNRCYAVGMTHRLASMGQAKYADLTVNMKPAAIASGVGVGGRHFNGKVKCDESALELPLSWRKPRRVFVNSMGDLFHKAVPFEFIDKVFAVMALCPQHTFQVLTKRPERMAEYLQSRQIGTEEWTDNIGHEIERLGTYSPASFDAAERYAGSGVLPNVWLGTSCGHQAAADEMIPHLLRCPAAVSFLSCEPLWGPVDLAGCMNPRREIMGLGGPYTPEVDAGVHWVIAGGESGPGARPCDVAWLRSLRDQCKAAGVPFFVKQLGALVVMDAPATMSDWPSETKLTPFDDGVRIWLNDRKGGDMSEWPEDLRVREVPS